MKRERFVYLVMGTGGDVEYVYGAPDRAIKGAIEDLGVSFERGVYHALRNGKVVFASESDDSGSVHIVRRRLL